MKKKSETIIYILLVQSTIYRIQVFRKIVDKLSLAVGQRGRKRRGGEGLAGVDCLTHTSTGDPLKADPFV